MVMRSILKPEIWFQFSCLKHSRLQGNECNAILNNNYDESFKWLSHDLLNLFPQDQHPEVAFFDDASQQSFLSDVSSFHLIWKRIRINAGLMHTTFNIKE